MLDTHIVHVHTLIRTKLEQVQQVHYINCSFPAIEAQAPDFEMLNWDSLSSSSWFVRWSPSWSVEVSLGFVLCPP